MRSHSVLCSMVTGAAVGAASEGGPLNASLDKQIEELKGRVEADVTDFDAWTALLSTCEKLDDPEKLGSVYQAFLAEYPLFQAYWKKYSSATGRHGGDPVKVFEQGVAAIPHSVDLWVQYAQHLITIDAPSEKVTEIFERGLRYVSKHFLSHALWDKYIEYQLNQQATASVSEIYTRILGLPIQQLERYFTSFKAYVATRTIYELMPASEIEQERAKVAAAASSHANTEGEGGGEQKEKEKEEEKQLSEDDKLKRSWMEPKLATYEATKRKRKVLLPFEDSIKGSHDFHVHALEKEQLSNWNKYLDYEEKEGNLGEVCALYERVLIPCASYPDFWIRYALYLESKGELKQVREVLDRATTIHTKRKPDCYLWRARFYERCGEIENARRGYQHLLQDVAPGLLQGIVAYANLERRQGSAESASKVFQEALERAMPKDEDKDRKKMTSNTFAYIAIHYARFVHHVRKDIEKARSIYEYALGIAPHQRILWESYVLLETYAQTEKGKEEEEDLHKRVSKIFKRALATDDMSIEDKEQLSLHGVEYTDLLGNTEELSSLQRTHRKFFHNRGPQQQVSRDKGKKRGLETDLTSAPKRVIPAPTPNENVGAALPMNNHTLSYQQQPQQEYYGNGQNYDYSQQQAYANYYYQQQY